MKIIPKCRKYSQGPFLTHGYSLLELAAVISIIAVILGLSISAGSMQMRMAEYRGTRENLETIRTALDLYKAKYGRYPCPARLDLAPTDANYGRSHFCGPSDTCPAPPPTLPYVACPSDVPAGTVFSTAIGAVPFRELGIGEEISLDKWDNRIVYAVDRAHTVSSGSGLGRTRIIDQTGNEITQSPVSGEAIYVLTSMGANEMGAFGSAGNLVRACGAGRNDVENCDFQAVATQNNIFRDMPKNQGAVESSIFDDEILWKTQDWNSLSAVETTPGNSMPEGVLPAKQNLPEFSAQSRLATWWLSTCAVNRAQEAYCWGNNDWGRIGDGTIGNRNLGTNGSANDLKDPTPVNGGFADWVSLSTHLYTTCGVRANGKGYCWGSVGTFAWGNPGAVGNGENDGEYLTPQLVSQDNTPSFVPATITDWVHISTSTATCGLRANGTIYCWGNGGDGMLGNGSSSGSVNLPIPIDGPTGPGDRFNDWANVEVWDHACAVRTNGLGYCWGTSNGNGELGIGSTAPRTRPTLVAGGITDWKKINVGPNHSCGTTQSGRGYCWGQNSEGQVGDNSTTARTSPTEVNGDHGDWSLIDAGDQFSCGLRNGKAYCWGSTASNRLGLTSIPASCLPSNECLVPMEVSGNISDWAYINAASDHTCGLRSNDSIWCWGTGSNREQGDGDTNGSVSPVNASLYSR